LFYPAAPSSWVEFDELCFKFGIELDGIDEDRNYKIDIGANRYDLLCLEGIARSLNAFLGRSPAPIYRALKPASGQLIQMNVDASVKGIRPFVVCAVLRGVIVQQVVNSKSNST
jgi:phenylalanyl-tRNA synthetase beta chain